MAQLGRWLGLDGWRLGARDLGERDGSAGPGGAGGGARSPAARQGGGGLPALIANAIPARFGSGFGTGSTRG